MKRSVLGALFCFSLLGNCIQIQPNIMNNLSPLLITALSVTSGPRFLAFTNTNVVYQSTGNGAWTATTFTGPSKINRIAQVGTTLIGTDGVTSGTIWKSTDRGSTWTSQTGIGTGAIEGIAASGTTVVVGIQGGGSGIFTQKSTDSGLTFGSQANPDAASANSVRTLVAGSSTFFVLTTSFQRGLYSNNSGVSWTAPATPPTIVPTGTAISGSTVVSTYAATGPDIAKSTDSGVNYSNSQDSSIFGATSRAIANSSGTFIFGYFDNASQCYFRKSTTGSGWSSSPGLSCAAGTTVNAMAATGATFVAGGTRNSLPMIIRSTDTGASIAFDTLPSASGATVINEIIYAQ